MTLNTGLKLLIKLVDFHYRAISYQEIKFYYFTNITAWALTEGSRAQIWGAQRADAVGYTGLWHPAKRFPGYTMLLPWMIQVCVCNNDNRSEPRTATWCLQDQAQRWRGPGSPTHSEGGSISVCSKLSFSHADGGDRFEGLTQPPSLFFLTSRGWNLITQLPCY